MSETIFLIADSRDSRAIREGGLDSNFRQGLETAFHLDGDPGEWQIALQSMDVAVPATQAGKSLFVYCTLAAQSTVGSIQRSILQIVPCGQIIGSHAQFTQQSTVVPWRPIAGPTSFSSFGVEITGENGQPIPTDGQCVVTLAFRRRI